MATPGSSAAGSSSASSSTSAVFLQYNAVLTLLRLLYVANLKNVMRDLQQGPFHLYHLQTSGKKAELQDRIIMQLDKARSENNVHLFTHIYDAIKRNSGRPGWGQSLENSRVIGTGNTLGATPGSSSAAASGTPGASAAAGSSSTGGAGSYRYGYGGGAGAGAGGSGAQGSPAAGVPYNKLNAAGGWSGGYVGAAAGVGTSASGARAGAGRPSFRPSPFFELKSMVSSMALCPEAGPNERKNVIVHFSLNTESQALLKETKHQVRLFCTNYEAYNASVQYANRPAPVIFPLTCEARVNDKLLTANLKGNRKVPGKVPPPNLNKDKALHLDAKLNKVELSYVNTTYQKYAMICGIVETHSIQSLVDKVKARPLTVDMVVNSILRLGQDDEIEAGAVKMTLRCPLSAMRIKVPSRSKRCTHRQCFDADTFFQLNEQTPSWNCPVCNNPLNPDDLILDQYVETILNQVPEDQDSIVVEPDASWHTEDNKYRSAGSAPNGSSSFGANGKGKEAESKKPVPDVIIMDLSPSPPSSPRVSGSGQPTSSGSGSGSGSAPYTVSSGSSTPSWSGSRPGGAAPPPRRSEPIVIDLTLSSDEDDAPPPPPVRRPPAPVPSSSSAASASGSSRPGVVSGADAPGAQALPPLPSGGSSASPSPFATSSYGARPGSALGRTEPLRDALPRLSDNAPQPPGRPLAPSSQAVRRPREDDSQGEGDDDDDDNVVLSPDRRRVRRRIQASSSADDSQPLAETLRRANPNGSASSGSVRAWSARNGNEPGGRGAADDDDEDDAPLLPQRWPSVSGAARTSGLNGSSGAAAPSSASGRPSSSANTSAGGAGTGASADDNAFDSSGRAIAGIATSRWGSEENRRPPSGASSNSSSSAWNLSAPRPGSSASNLGSSSSSSSNAPRPGWQAPSSSSSVRDRELDRNGRWSNGGGSGADRNRDRDRDRDHRFSGSSWAGSASRPSTFTDYLGPPSSRSSDAHQPLSGSAGGGSAGGSGARGGWPAGNLTGAGASSSSSSLTSSGSSTNYGARPSSVASNKTGSSLPPAPASLPERPMGVSTTGAAVSGSSGANGSSASGSGASGR
ncbi:E3 SUMO-protein ligase pli1 [Tilletia horrida]|nr:E3 SUMO-protein ligase pli1 [Tilletia horrida]